MCFSYRKTPFLIRVHIISCCVLLDVSMVAEEVGYSFAPSGVSRYDDFFNVFSLLSSSRHLLRLSNNLAIC